MSTWIHCNHCFVVPTNDCNKVRFWFTSCGHLLCAECLKAKRSNNNNGQHFECLLCHQQNVQLVELNRHLRPELLALFRPAKDLIDEFNAKLKQVLTFQQSHQKRLVDHLTDKAQRATKWAQSVQKDMQKVSAERDKLKLDLEQSNEKSRKTEEMLANTRHELQRLANKFHQQHHRGNHHQRRTRPLSSSVANFATPATVAGIPSARRPSSVAAHSVQHFRFHPPTAVASSSNTSLGSRGSFSYLSPATLSYNRSMGSSTRSVPPLLPGRITNAPIVPPSFTIHNARDNNETDSARSARLSEHAKTEQVVGRDGGRRKQSDERHRRLTAGARRAPANQSTACGSRADFFRSP
ncbi:hypothetical protein niasHT_014334 [Heterodera trifolii]|uniref:RING-type domain-containing protein n=1 Tax=Heterodera trifolii TaxID=157864 RepID=A0ABD2LH29_9BILA